MRPGRRGYPCGAGPAGTVSPERTLLYRPAVLSDVSATIDDGPGDTALAPTDARATRERPSARGGEPGDGLARPALYVGIGASAGGLDALREFFTSIAPDTGAAFVVVQHLSPDHKSIMDELLSRHTSMPVVNVVDGMRLAPDSVYLAPPRKNLVLTPDDTLRLGEPETGGAPNLPIDVFFRTLAHRAEHHAVGIVLSGTGSDGSRGIRAVKASEGLVLVQDPDTAGFDGMPVSAIHTGLADFVLSPPRLAEYLGDYARRPRVPGEPRAGGRRLESEQAVLGRIFELLRTGSRIDFAHYKSSTVARRIERRMSINQIEDLEGYLTLLEGNAGEVQTLGRELLINVTSFFRDAHAFARLGRDVANPVVESADADSEVRVWVAGCSTGEEAYSVAMLFEEARMRAGSSVRVKIFATDVDESAIAEASLGRFPADIEGDVSPERLGQHFSLVDGAWVLRPEIRQMVVFAAHNMIADPPFSNVDLICCRNALIYFQQSVQQRILASFHFALKRGGHLFLGSSEGIGELTSHFDTVDEECRLYRKVSNNRVPVSTSLREGVMRVPTKGLPPVTNLLRGYRAAQRDQSFDHVKDALINDHAPACLVLDTDHRVVHVYGDAGKYLTRFPSGRVSTDVEDLVAEELSVAVGTSLARAQREAEPVRYSGIELQVQGRELMLELQTEHHPERNGRAAHFVVLIREQGEEGGAGPRGIGSFDIPEQTRRRIKDLEAELISKQEHLHVANEELETTNEQLQNANEELMSSNEELQSANEELQSVNEELFTVNSEYQAKINELTVVNDDLANVLGFTSIGIVFVDERMCIRKFTQVAARFFHLLPADVGRPLHHISNELDYPDLFADIEAVVRDNRTFEREVFTRGGELVETRLVPYLSSAGGEGRQLGAILTLADLSARTRRDRERHERAFGTREAPVQASGETGLGSGEGTAEAVFAGPRLSLRVLVVDDQPEERYALARQLSRANGLQVEAVEADSVGAALDELEHSEIDLCLVDFRLEGETANELVDSLSARAESPPVIVLSNATRAELGDLLRDEGISGFVSKGDATPLRLGLAIRNALVKGDTPERAEDA